MIGPYEFMAILGSQRRLTAEQRDRQHRRRENWERRKRASLRRCLKCVTVQALGYQRLRMLYGDVIGRSPVTRHKLQLIGDMLGMSRRLVELRLESVGLVTR